MAEDKKIRVGVDSSAFDTYESRMRQSSENLARDMIRSSRSYTTSAKETLTTIEEQIRAIEKRNALDRDFREREVASAREGGEITSQQAKARMTSIGQESKEDKLQTQLLRELIDTVKSSSKQEIREDRMGVERRLQESRTVGVLAPDMDEFDSLRESIQQQYVSELGTEEASQRGFSGAGMQQYAMMPMNFLGSRNALDVAGGAVSAGGGMMGKMGGTGGLIGMLVAATVGKAIQVLGSSAETLEGQLGDRARLGRGSVRHFDPSGYSPIGLGRHGMTIGDFEQNRANLEIGARTSDFGESAANLMYLSKGTMLSEGDVSGLVGLRRHGGGTASGTTNFMEQYLKQTGQSMAVLPEIIQQFTSTATGIISQKGEVDTAKLASLMTTIGGQTGLVGQPMMDIYSGIQRGSQRSSNPVLQALQMQAARDVAGEGASFFELRKIMADPENIKYQSAYMSKIKGISGESGDRYKTMLMDAYDWNPFQAEYASNLDLSKGLTEEQSNKLKKLSFSYESESASVTGQVGASGKALESKRQQVAFEKAQDLAASMLGLAEKVGELKDSLTEHTDKQRLENAKKTAEALEKLANGDTEFLQGIALNLEITSRIAASNPLAFGISPGFMNKLFNIGK